MARHFALIAVAALAGCAGSGSTAGVIPQSVGRVATQSVELWRTLVFTNHKKQTVQTPTDLFAQTNNCGSILKSVTYFDYGIWIVTPGNTNGKCEMTFTNSANGRKLVAVVINTAN